MDEKINIILIEDSREYRDVIRLTISRDSQLNLLGEFGTAEIALRKLKDSNQARPDVVLLDLRLPGMSGLDALPKIKEASPTSKVIILSQSDREADIVLAISRGVSGYLLKSSTMTEIKLAIHDVMQGGVSLDSTVAKFMVQMLQNTVDPDQNILSITKRETEVLIALSEGLVKKQISERLGISYDTVDSHVRHIYQKLDVSNAPSAVAKAFHAGLLKANSKSV